MPKSFTFALLTSVALLGASSVANAKSCSAAHTAAANKVIPNKGLNASVLNSAILVEVNKQRCARGLAPLTSKSGLVSEAQKHSRWMSSTRKLSHKATRGNATLTARLKSSGVRFRTGAENIAMLHLYNVDGRRFVIRSQSDCIFETQSGARIPKHSYASLARHVVAKWMESSGHRRNILNKKVQFSGIGGSITAEKQRCGEVFLTHIFAG